MQAADTQQRAELKLAFVRHLPRRLEALAQRTRHFVRDGWDINGLLLLHDDVQRLAGVAGRYGDVAASDALGAFETLLGDALQAHTFPDADAVMRIERVLEQLLPPGAGQDAAADAHAQVPHETSERSEVAPVGYWRRWNEDAGPPEMQSPMTATPPPSLAGSSEVAPRTPEANPAPSVPQTPARPTGSASAPRRADASSADTAVRGRGRVHHLRAGDALSDALDQRLESLGHVLERSGDLDGFLRALDATAADAPGIDAVIVDAAFLAELDGIGDALQRAREAGRGPAVVLALADEDSIPVRLAARRAGIDALLPRPQTATEITGKLEELLGAAREAPYRVLIVEDDRSQALFAESVLRNAGMEVHVVTDAFDVLDAMAAFKPEMVLMDLYMPQCDGTELTALIREREDFLHTPIVFLSGESDQEKHFEALSVGGDDFLAKPIRPRHLVASVSNRVQRARAVRARAAARDPRDPDTGLYQRSFMLDRLNEAVSGAQHTGGMLFLEIDNVHDLRERLGLSSVETLLRDLSRYIVRQVGHDMPVSRHGDACFVVLDGRGEQAALDAQATYLRERINGHSFIVSGQPVRLRAAVGLTAFDHSFADAGAALNAAERACRQARLTPTGVRRFEPPRRADRVRADALVDTLRRALDNDALELLYQPIVALQGGEDARYQTLVRLRGDDDRLHPAAQIVPLAAEAGLLPQLDRWVLEHALQVIDERGAEQRPVHLFVNQSALSLAEDGYADWLASQLGVRSTPAGALVIELAARDAGERLADTLAFCQTMAPLGVQFCLSQYRSTPDIDHVLETLPIDLLKLDGRYFEPNAPAAARDEVRAIVTNAHARGLQVIAPRVEDAKSAAQLWMSGVDYIQGNLVQLAGRELEFDFQSAVL